MIRSTLYPFALQLLKVYWRLFSPVAHGVKILARNAHLPGKVLLVKNTYGRRDVWHLPGGGFNPDKETVESAAQRELFEELGVENVAWLHLGDYKTEAQGKRDNVTILSCVLTATTLSLGSEIASAEWVNVDAIGKAYKVYEVTRFALNLDRQSVTKAEVV